jgi:proton-translocating NAD(P)+ transhydrogenase subunit alpha
MQTSRVTLGVLRERRHGESRVALVPADIKRLTAVTRVYVERGAGGLAGMADEEYVAAGAHIVTASEVFAQADVLLGVRPPESLEPRCRSASR